MAKGSQRRWLLISQVMTTSKIKLNPVLIVMHQLRRMMAVTRLHAGDARQISVGCVETDLISKIHTIISMRSEGLVMACYSKGSILEKTNLMMIGMMRKIGSKFKMLSSEYEILMKLFYSRFHKNCNDLKIT